jgi:hypothetical protein
MPCRRGGRRSLEVTTLPASSIATHNASDGHDSAGRASVPATAWLSCQADAPPAGSVDVTIAPSPRAAQNAVVGHDTGPSRPFASTLLGGDQVIAPPAGSLDVSTFPLLSTATHNDTDGHDSDTSS